MQNPSGAALLRYGGAVAAVLLATAARLALDPLLGDLFPFATLFFAVLFVAGYGGRGPALLATGMGAVLSARFLLPPRASFAVLGVENQAGLLLYLVVGVGIAVLGGALRDARKRARADAKESSRQREQLRITLASIGDAVLVTDDRGRVTSLNPVAEALTGWASPEAEGQPLPAVFRIVNEETRREVENPALRALREGVVVGLANHTILIARDGTERPIDDSAAPIRGPDGRVVGAVLTFRDIGEKKRAEAEARRAGERSRTILESITDAFFALDRDWRFTHVNRQAEALLGRNRDDLLGKSLWEEYPETLGNDIERRYRRAMQGSVAVEFEEFYPPHGRWYENHLYPSEDGLSVYFRDITARKEGEEALQSAHRELEARVAERTTDLSKANEFLRALLESIQDGIVACDAEGVLTLFNRATQEFHGLPPEPLPADRWAEHYDLYRADGQTRLPREEVPLFRALRGEPVRGVEMVIAPRDGPVRALLASGQAFRDDRGRTLGAVVSMHDITARKAAEAALRRAHDELELRVAERTVELRAAKEEADAANRAKTQFLAVLSHELRTPLNPILLAASSMLDRPCDPEDVRPTLEMIRTNVNLQARLIDDLLDVMRIVQGKMPLHWKVADCHRVIDQAIEICRSEVSGHDLRLTVEAVARHRHVNADAARLQQVFWNLIKNAVKFTPEGGAITVRTRNVGEGGEDRIVVEVIDTGIGIEPDVLPRIFDPFQQGETTITRKFGGLGLGLAICKGVVEAHGGMLEAESPGGGRGATFRVVLKALPEQAIEGNGQPVGGGPTVESHRPSSLRILVVEDEPTTLRLMARLLRGLGHAVTTANTIASGCEAFEADEFDLIVSDIGLPDGTGLDLMRRAVALRGPIPAIALTGYGMEDDIMRSRRAGFTAHMTKPIDFTKLESMIRQVASDGVEAAPASPRDADLIPPAPAP